MSTTSTARTGPGPLRAAEARRSGGVTRMIGPTGSGAVARTDIGTRARRSAARLAAAHIPIR